MKHAVIGKQPGLPLTLALIAMLAGVGAARASSITYDVDLTIGAGSVVGSVTTNGATGVLVSADFTNWNLELNGPGASFDLTPTNSVAFILGSDATATTRNILFNFSGTAGDILVFQDGLYSGYNYFCAAVTTTSCKQGEGVVPQYYTDPSAQYMSVTGTQVIATVPSTPAPEIEPASAASGLTLLLGALLVLRGRRSVTLNSAAD
jgi:hypothetical protein